MIKNGHTQLAIATALWSNFMNIAMARQEFIAAGGKYPHDNGLRSSLGNSDGGRRLARSRDDQDSDDNNNFLLHLVTYLIRRMPNPIGYCLICDKSIVNKEIEDPTICTVGTCQFNYIELGVCQSIPVSFCPASISDDIMNNPDVVDLYISMAVAAATSHRKNMIFDPFPPQYMRGATKDFDAIVHVLNLVPSVDEMQRHCDNEGELIHYLSEIDSTGGIYSLLSWILSIDRSALLKMPPNLHIAAMKTPHQYMMPAGNDPKKAADFKAWRKEYGSYFAFHGSGIENWHSILRKGLLNCSGTSLQTTGAAYGPGVYLAPDSGTSMGYARTGAAWRRSRFGDSSSLVCMAIAEVVKHPEAPHTPNPYYVVKKAELVATRFFLFYPGGMSGVQSVQANTLDLSKYV